MGAKEEERGEFRGFAVGSHQPCSSNASSTIERRKEEGKDINVACVTRQKLSERKKSFPFHLIPSLCSNRRKCKRKKPRSVLFFSFPQVVLWPHQASGGRAAPPPLAERLRGLPGARLRVRSERLLPLGEGRSHRLGQALPHPVLGRRRRVLHRAEVRLQVAAGVGRPLRKERRRAMRLSKEALLAGERTSISRGHDLALCLLRLAAHLRLSSPKK